MSKDNDRRRSVAISDLAEMGFCERKVLLKSRHGDQDTPETSARRAAGRQQHAQFDQQVRQHHNQHASRDRRCFVATAVYGGSDPRTEELREFRDQCLMANRWGVTMVWLYYLVSPRVAQWIDHHPRSRVAVSWLLDQLRMQVRKVRNRNAR